MRPTDRRGALSSLGLTLGCLLLLAALVVLCTLGQVELGTFNAVDRYFRAAFLWAELPGGLRLPWFPAGGAVGLLLLVNLVAVMLWRLPRTRRKSGLWLVHVGLALFVVGEFATGMLAVETQLPIEEGQSRDYTESPRRDELAVIEAADPAVETVYAVRQEALRDGRVLSHPDWPFTLRVVSAFRNAELGRRPEGVPGLPASVADRGLGPTLLLKARAPVSRDDERNLPAAFLEVSGQGTWLVSSALGAPQEFSAGGRRWRLALRPERRYMPFTLTLKDFRFDRYAGTDIPRNYSSAVRLSNAARGEERDVLIWMNNPLRYMGRTFYQASFGKNETLSVLQVVENPGWLLPYLSFILVGAGLLLHFGLMMREAKAPAAGAAAAAPRGPERLAAWTALAAAAVVILSGFRPPPASPIDAARLGRLPVLHNGRVKPLDTIARTSLLVIHGKQALEDGGERLGADRWLLELAADARKANARPLFVIHDPDLLGLLGRRESGKAVLSFDDLTPQLPELARQAQRADAVEAPLRTRFEAAVHQLHARLVLFHRLRNTLAAEDSPGPRQETAEYGLAVAQGVSDFLDHGSRAKPTRALERLGLFFARYRDLDALAYYKPVPPAPGAPADAWATVPQDLLGALKEGRVSDEAAAWAGLLDSARAGEGAPFAAALSTLEASARARAPEAARRARWEAVFNAAQPFTRGMALYLAAFLCAMLSHLVWGVPLRRAALWLLGAALAVHTGGLAARMWLQGRPPVTNLYSSAVFVGWAAALGALVLERSHRGGLAAAVGAAAGFAGLLIAHHLAASGDTLEMMQAVLDSNFWLGTHVVTITIGYAGTFLAGLLAHVWILKRTLGSLSDEEGRSLYRMTYGVVAFSLLLSFVGTVLGGIWADQSWGRFWGWDPKENGAFLIVLWCAILLHARMGGYVRERGFMAMTVAGCVVTALSWFGVNMLGIGLHSYGFMDKAAGWLGAFCLSQFAVAGLAFIPPRARGA